MSLSVYNRKNFDFTNENMFMGEKLNVARFDKQRHPIFEGINRRMLSLYWVPEEISMVEDIRDWRENMDEGEKHIFTSNLNYQTFLDSVQGRSPTQVLLPMASLPEIEGCIETWAFFECLAEGTEVLTPTGWKDLSEVSVNDDCLVYNLENDVVFFEKPKNVFEYDVDDELIEYKSRNGKQFHQLVTPNHRMPVVLRSKAGHKQTRMFKYAQDQDYKAHHLAPISGYIQCANDTPFTPLHQLLVATQADGAVSARYTGERCGTTPIWFELTKQRKIDRLLEICKAGEFNVTELTSNGDARRFKVDIPLSCFSGDPKTFEWVDLSNISLAWCDSFMLELAEWDSHKFGKEGKCTFTYTTTVKENSDKIQAIATLCGRSPRLSIIEDNRKDTHKDVYSINIINSNMKDGQSIEKTKVPYKGKVRCLETSTGAFLIRYKGVVSVTGNCIHSRSYSHMIRNVYNDPSEVFDRIMVTPEILKRAETVTAAYDDLYNTYVKYELGTDPFITERMVKEKLHDCMVAVNVLESVRFYASFACTLAFHKQQKMRGSGNIITLIARDEAEHTNLTRHIYRYWAMGMDDPEMKEICSKRKDVVYETFNTALKQEKEWAGFLFHKGSMRGMNEKIISQYLDYISERAMKAMLLDVKLNTQHPIPWIEDYFRSSARQNAPQETENTAYLVGAIQNDIESDDYDDMFGDDL